MTTALVPIERTAERHAAQMLAALHRLGFVHRNGDGSEFHVRFDSLEIDTGGCYVVAGVDVGRLYHFSVSELATRRVEMQLSASLKLPVYVRVQNGLYFIVRLKPKAALPTTIDLPPDVPLGDYPVGLGVSADGPVWRELGMLTHIVVAGSSDSGKSAFLRSLVYQLARMVRPVELYLTDMEGLTFEWARSFPILARPIAQDVDAALDITRALLAEIERRGALYASTGRYPESLDEYHAAGGERLPRIVAIFDEFTPLAEQAGHGSILLDNISQLAMRSRKFGVTLVLAGQDFKADIMNTRITNQAGTRVQFRAATAHQSRIVLGEGCACMIRTPGRAYARLGGRSKIIELQTYWVDKARVTSGAPQIAGPAIDHRVRLVLEAALVDGRNVRQEDIAGAGFAERKAAEIQRQLIASGWLVRGKGRAWVANEGKMNECK